MTVDVDLFPAGCRQEAHVSVRSYSGEDLLVREMRALYTVGDATAHDLLRRRLRPLITRALKVVVNDAPATMLEPSDLDHAAVLGVLRSWDRFDGRASLEAFARGPVTKEIVANIRALGYGPRQPSRITILDEDNPIAEPADPAATAAFVAVEDALAVDAVRRALSPQEWRVLEALFMDEVPMKDVARRLGVTRQTIRNVRERALLKARRLLRDDSTRPSAGAALDR